MAPRSSLKFFFPVYALTPTARETLKRSGNFVPVPAIVISVHSPQPRREMLASFLRHSSRIVLP